MKTVRVEYTVRTTGEDGKPVSVNKERVLFEMDSTDSEHIGKILEQEEQPPEQSAHEDALASLSIVVTKITELKPTGDDDQM